jgi:hypothetical protein
LNGWNGAVPVVSVFVIRARDSTKDKGGRIKDKEKTRKRPWVVFVIVSFGGKAYE